MQSFPEQFSANLVAHGLPKMSRLFSNNPVGVREDQWNLRWSEEWPFKDDQNHINQINSSQNIVYVNFKDAGSLYAFGSRTCALELDCDELGAVEREIISKCFLRAYSTVLAAERTQLRRDIIEHTIESRDLNSFCHKILHKTIKNYANFEAASFFFEDPINKLLYMTSTTGIISSERPETKANAFIDPEQDDYICRAFKDKRELWISRNLYDATKHTFKETTPSKFYQMVIWPVGLQKIFSHGTASYQAGVLRLVNPYMRHGKQTLMRDITWEDWYILDFLGEIIAILARTYISRQERRHQMERVIHGLTSSIDTITNNITTAVSAMFGDPSRKIERSLPYFSSHASIDEKTIRIMFEDCLSFASDLRRQIDMASREGLTDIKLQRFKLFPDILMQLYRWANDVSRLHNKRTPKFNNFKDGGAAELPCAIGDPNLILNVLRNLVENSVKYGKPGQHTSICFRFLLSLCGKYILIYVDDDNQVIPESERTLIFKEGFRSNSARASDNRGSGIGLSYAKDVMDLMLGEILYEPIGGGNRFILKVPCETRKGLSV